MSLATFYTHSPGRMSDGSRFHASAMACASRVYPLHSRLRIVAANGRRVIVIVTDRTARGRKNVDCTPAAFSALCGRGINYRAQGVLHVHVHRLRGGR
jgi:rare lipoprotein A (peptidoglycan hydrolase)